jgi:hypothetical protein
LRAKEHEAALQEVAEEHDGELKEVIEEFEVVLEVAEKQEIELYEVSLERDSILRRHLETLKRAKEIGVLKTKEHKAAFQGVQVHVDEEAMEKHVSDKCLESIEDRDKLCLQAPNRVYARRNLPAYAIAPSYTSFEQVIEIPAEIKAIAEEEKIETAPVEEMEAAVVAVPVVLQVVVEQTFSIEPGTC